MSDLICADLLTYRMKVWDNLLSDRELLEIHRSEMDTGGSMTVESMDLAKGYWRGW
jgi:hypothetical protein